MTRFVLKQRARGDHGSLREVRVVREGLEEGFELEMRSEGVRWPLCGKFLQFVSDSFDGGHRESCGASNISGVSNRYGTEVAQPGTGLGW